MYGRSRKANRKMRLVPIDSTKNLVQFNLAVPAASVGIIALAAGVNPKDIDEADIAKTWYVEDGSMIRGFNIGLRLYNETGVVDSNSSLMFLRKDTGTTLYPPTLPGLPTLAQCNTLGAQAFKNRIFHIEQAITGSQVSGWPMGFPSIKIPKRFHSMKIGDYWYLIIANNTGNQLRCCGLCMYKWYK